MKQIELELEKIVVDSFDSDSLFLVDILISKGNGPQKIRILIDGDEGVNIDTCAAISRKVGEEIETQELLQKAYVLEVSSPGLDFPLKLIRQYQKNIGRRLKIKLVNGDEIKGLLKAVEEDSILVTATKKGKNKKNEDQDVEINFTDIKQTNVLVSFK